MRLEIVFVICNVLQHHLSEYNTAPRSLVSEWNTAPRTLVSEWNTAPRTLVSEWNTAPRTQRLGDCQISMSEWNTAQDDVSE